MDPQVAFKNIIIAAILLGIIAFAALGFRPGSVSTVGQGGGNSWGGGEGSGYSWGSRGENGDHDDD